MNKKILIPICCIIILIIIGVVVFFFTREQPVPIEKEQESNNEMKQSSTMYDENANLEDLKQEYKMTGSDELYEIQTEEDGRKVLYIKPDINYKVAFAGIIKGTIPDFTEIDSIYETNYPTENGIWVEQNSREQIRELFNKFLSSEYEIVDGYLKIKNENTPSENDKKLKEIINGDKQFILSISGVSYLVDTVSGNILDNPFEEFDKYQIYEYVECENNKIIFITENNKKALTDEEIFDSILNLILN